VSADVIRIGPIRFVVMVETMTASSTLPAAASGRKTPRS
jgi:hypothetical protein